MIILLPNNNNNKNMKFDHYLTCRLPPQVIILLDRTHFFIDQYYRKRTFIEIDNAFVHINVSPHLFSGPLLST